MVVVISGSALLQIMNVTSDSFTLFTSPLSNGEVYEEPGSLEQDGQACPKMQRVARRVGENVRTIRRVRHALQPRRHIRATRPVREP